MRNRNWFWGLLFLLSAMMIIAGQIWPFDKIGIVSIIATVFLAALVIDSLIHRSYFGIFIPLSILYLIYCKPLMLPGISPWLLISSALLVTIGFSLLFPKHYTGGITPSHGGNGYSGGYKENIGKDDPHGKDELHGRDHPYDEDNPYVKVVLNSVSKYLHSENLHGGNFIAHKATLEVYFDQVQLAADGAEIFVHSNLSSIDLYVPKHWNVIDNTQSYLGSVDFGAGHAGLSENAPKLVVSGNVVLGVVNIHYI